MTVLEPDTKDWTWVLDTPCPECGFVAADVGITEVGARLRDNAALWATVLQGPRARRRPAPQVWSPAEYACHVRDVHAVFGERLRLMLTRDDPTFADWDQDATAVAERYDEQDPAAVAPVLVANAAAVAERYDGVRGDQRTRRGLRSNGSEFTVESIARYHLHDVVHHLWDVRAAVTVAAYDGAAAAYRDASAPAGDGLLAGYRSFVQRVGAGGRVLEIGSGGGRDAQALEEVGLSVRRTDVAAGFVALLREAGHRADVLDPLTDVLSDPARSGAPYDGVWANASLLHVARADLPVVLARLAAVTRPGGVLRLSVKEGDGEAWSTHGSVTMPRMFTYWRGADLAEVIATAGWDVEETAHRDGLRGENWLETVAVRTGGG